jgi:hypothetical protein
MSSIGYVTIGAVDGEKSGAFFDAAFGALGSERQFENRNESGFVVFLGHWEPPQPL